MGDLTTLAAVKAALGIGTGDVTADEQLRSLITEYSSRFEGAADRTFARATYSETFDGGGRRRIPLTNYPVVSVSSVTVDGVPVSERVDVTGIGWVLRDKEAAPMVELVGPIFTDRVQNVVIAYVSGFGDGTPGTIPEDIQRAVTETVVAAYKGAAYLNVQQSSVGGESVQFRQPFLWPPFAYDVLRDYRRPGLS